MLSMYGYVWLVSSLILEIFATVLPSFMVAFEEVLDPEAKARELVLSTSKTMIMTPLGNELFQNQTDQQRS